jgi:hypothetical protein
MKAIARGDQTDLTRADLQLGALLLNSHRLIGALSESDLLAKHEINLSEWAVLHALGDAQDLPLKEIVRQTGMAVPQIRKAVRDLKAKQLVAVNTAEQPGAPPRGISAVPKSGRIRAAILGDLQGLVSTLARRGPSANQAGGALDAQTKVARRLANAARLSAQVIRAISPPRAAAARPKKKDLS